MSKLLINQYYTALDRIIQYGGSRNETSIRSAFVNLINEYAQKHNLHLITELAVKGTLGKAVYPDGILKNALRLDFGYWESKDESDDINEEISKKINKGYPLTNILFEDSQTAVLYQNGQETMRVNMKDADALDRILNAFTGFIHPEILRFEEAVEKFKEDIPDILKMLREKVDEASRINPAFVAARDTFLELCRAEINPDITPDDVREMMNQHILTADIFNVIFDDPHFHHENNIGRELERLIGTFFTGSERRNTLASINHYYKTLNAAAANIADHHEKQKFLKVIYENFYKVYNPNAADRLGVVYTPGEIVHFMITSTDYLLHKHFNRTLADEDVDILDPATGTGTFICDLIEYLPKAALPQKYKNEIHANEIAILPYYIANLNIEYTYKQKMDAYAEFKNICFVDTLDNTAGLESAGKQGALFGFSSENSERIQRQNERKISVIIGNPPYNANQQNENENNKNREYAYIDKRIKDTFIKYSTAQKSKVYDPYARFYRWAMDRIDKTKGIVCFITNNSFVNARTFDGFRKSVEDEFSEAYVIDLGGDIRKLSGKDGIFLNEQHTVFGVAAAVGIAIMFLVKKTKEVREKCRIYYIHPCDIRATRKEKFDWLQSVKKFNEIPFIHILPDEKHNWIDLTDNDWQSLLPFFGKSSKENSLFSLSSNGISTNRDEWVYDFSFENLHHKIAYFIDEYNHEVNRWKTYKKDNNYKESKKEADPVLDKFLATRNKIKWSKMIKRDKLRKGKIGVFQERYIRPCLYRFFTKKKISLDPITIDIKGQMDEIFPLESGAINLAIVVGSQSQTGECFVSDCIVDLHVSSNGTRIFPFYRFDATGARHDNITDWGLQQFRTHYAATGVETSSPVCFADSPELSADYQPRPIEKEDIFHYTYAVLHDPAYRTKYELNLKRDFPRLPFYKDFWQWAAWGKELMDLHIGYESAEPYPLKRTGLNIPAPAIKETDLFGAFEVKAKAAHPKVKLKANKQGGSIEIDESTTLSGIPPEAWDYKLGNRSALEWVLDQYKEKKPKDPTIGEKFNTYRFADYKEEVIDLLKKVCLVSIKTMEIVKQMNA